MASNNKVRQALDHETRNLIFQLNEVHQKLKPGSAEREQKEDAIYSRLYQISEQIQQKHSNDPHLRELFFLITDQTLGTPARPQVTQLPVYSDPQKVFTKYPSSPQTRIFLEKMAQDLRTYETAEVRDLMADHMHDGPKEVVQSLAERCQREHWLKQHAGKTCSRCWDKVMREIFMMAVEVLTLELQTRSHQIIRMTEHGHLTHEDAQDLSDFFTETMHKLEKLLKKSEHKKITKHQWIRLVEEVFQLTVGIGNELMMRYILMLKVKQTT